MGQLNSPVEQFMSFIYSLQDVKISLERINEIHEGKNEESKENQTKSFESEKNISINNIDNLNAQNKPAQQSTQSMQNPSNSNHIDSIISPNKAHSLAISPAISPSSSPKIIHKIRSGEEISAQGSLSILGDITSGAKVSASGSVTVFGNCYGVLEVGGEFLILRSLQSGYIVFNGEILSADMLAKINANDKLKIIIKNGTNIVIKDIN